MADEGDGIWTITHEFAEGELFKIMVDNIWYGMAADGDYWVTAEKLNTGEVMQMAQDNQNLNVRVGGTYKLIFDANSKKLRMGAEAPVTVKAGIHGNVSVDLTQAIPGQIVTITAAPADGYYIEVGNIIVEKTINGGSAQAPGLKADGPGVGQFVTDIQAGEAPNTFTFAMPESPYGAKVSAEFQACIPITAAMIQPNPIPDQDYTGSQIKPAIVVMDGETTLVEGTDYTLEYGANVEPGEGTIIVTGKGKYTSTVTVTFTIKKGVHNVNVTSDGNGTVAAEPLSAVQGTDITLTITPNEGYELDKLTVGGTEVTVTGNTYTFEMPDADVAVNATFKKVDYTITVTSNEYGTVTVNDNKTTANFGDNITLTITPKEDCVLQELKVDGQVVEVEGNTYTFTMPSHNVAVEATFRALEVSYQVNYGKGNPWAQVNEIALVKGTDGKWTAADKEIPAEYEAVLVKIVDGQEVLLGAQSSGDFYINDNTLGQPISMGTFDGGHFNLYFPNAGIYNFSYDPAGKTLVVTGDYLYNITVTNPATEVTVDKTTAKAGETVTITVLSIPEGYEIDAVKVNDGAVEVILDEETGKYTFAMPASNATVTVTFKAATYTITVAENIENGTVEAPASAQYGTEVNVTVTPDLGYEVDALTYTVEGGEAVPIENNKFTMPAGNVTINATFIPMDVKYYVAYGVGDNWGDTRVDKLMELVDNKYVYNNLPLDNGMQFKIRKVVTNSAGSIVEDAWFGVGEYHYQITAERLGEEIELNSNNSQNLCIINTTTYGFSFDPATNKLIVTGSFLYNINITEPTNGSVTTNPEGPVTAGTEVTIVPTPNDGYRVDVLTVTYGENQTVEVADNKFTMPAADVTVTVTFTKILTNNALTWNVPAEKGTVTATVDGETVENGGLVQEGKTVVVTVTPTAEWTVSKVSVNNEDLTLADGTYTFTMPAAPAEIVVEFTAVQHNITITPNEFVTVTTDPAYTAAAGQEVTVTVTPNTPDDFVVGGVKVNGELVEPNEDGTYTFVMPAGDSGVTIDVVVEAKIQGVSFTADRNWATYIGAYNLVKPEGIKVYVVTGVASNAVVIEEVDYIPANVGVLLYGTAGEDLTTPLYTGATGTYTSKLVGRATEAQTITAGYVLYNNNFIRSEEGTVAAHRCYLPASEVAGAPRMLKIGYDGDVPTAIETLIAEGNVAKVMYVNMSGLTSDKPFRGVNIAVVTFTDGSTHTIKLVK